MQYQIAALSSDLKRQTDLSAHRGDVSSESDTDTDEQPKTKKGKKTLRSKKR